MFWCPRLVHKLKIIGKATSVIICDEDFRQMVKKLCVLLDLVDQAQFNYYIIGIKLKKLNSI